MCQLTRLRAIRWFELAAAQGHPVALYNLASAYLHGTGTLPNPREAIRYYRAAAESGEIEAAYALARALELGPEEIRDWPEAVRWHRVAADANHAAAQLLEMHLVMGDGLEQDVEYGEWYLRSAARRGDADAMFFLARLYEGGDLVKGDIREALLLYWMAALHGN